MKLTQALAVPRRLLRASVPLPPRPSDPAMLTRRRNAATLYARWRPSRSWLLLAAALAFILVVDFQAQSLPAQAQVMTPGSLDVSFGGDGIVTAGVAPAESKINAVAALSSGKVLAAGSSIIGSDLDFTLARYNADGSLDTAFGDGSGKVTTDFGEGADTIQALAVLSDGKILAAGYAHNSAVDFDFALARYTADGVLDTTFGTEGKVTTPIGSGHDEISAMAVLSDGKIVVAGNSHNGTNRDFALARYTAAGALDTTFGTVASGSTRTGHVVTPIGTDDDYGKAVAVHTDGTIVVGGYTKISGNNYDFAIARYTNAGALDTDFDSDGKVTTDFDSGNSNDRVQGVAALSDGKILAGGFSGNPSPRFGDFTLARYTAEGALDTTFGGDADGDDTPDGYIVSPVGSGTDNSTGMLMQSDGKILMGGYGWNGSDLDFAVARFTAAGALDTGFGGDADGDGTKDGYTFTPIGSGEDWANALALASGGNIVLGGFSHNGTENDFALVRYTGAGVLDTTFGAGGKVTTAAGSRTSYGAAVALQSDGKLVMVGDGYTGAASQYDFLLARFNADGTLDTGFGNDGVVTTDFNSGSSDYGAMVAVQSDGKILAAGRSNKGAAKDFGLARYNADGSLDTDFGTGGKVTTDFASGEDRPYAMTVQSDGKIVVVGYANNGSDNDFAIARYTNAGALDTSFDSDGKVVTALGAGNDRARAVAVQSDGKIVVGGGIGGDFAVARYNAGGSLDTGFGGDADNDNTPDGYVTTTMSTSDDTALAVAFQPDGMIVAAGAAIVGGDYDFAVARYSVDGTLDTGFGTVSGSTRTGWVTTPMSDNRDIAYGLLLQSGGSIVVTGWAGSTAGGVDRLLDFALARYTADGSLDANFGTGGKVTTPVSPGDDRAYGAVLQADGKIVLAGYAHSGKAYEFALARYHGTSTNADLSGLTASSSTSATGAFNDLTLTPAFDADTTSYSATVNNDITHVKLTPTTADSGATVEVAGSPVTNGNASPAQPVNVGQTGIFVEVTAEDGDTTKTYTVTITRQAATVSLSASPNPVNEGSSVTVTATLSHAQSADVTIPVTITDNSAQPEDHGTLASINISGGSTTGTGSITTTQDTADESDETFTVALGTLPSGITAGSPSSALITIRDDDTPPPAAVTVSLSASPTTVDEGGSVTVTATLSTAQTSALTIPVAITDNTADSGDHGTLTSITIAANSATGTGTITTTQDTSDESDETFTVALGTPLPSGITAGSPSSVQITIRDDDTTTPTPTTQKPTVSLSASATTVREGTSVTVTARLSRTRTSDTVVPVTLYANSAEEGDHGTLTSITIPSGSTTGTGVITTTMDSDTDDEVFQVGLNDVGSDADYTWGAVTWLDITILDSGLRQVSLTVFPNPEDEGTAVNVFADLTSLRWGTPASLGSDVTIPLTLTAGSAESGDYGSLASITITAGQTRGQGTISTTDDTDADDETFTVALDTANSAWPSGVKPGAAASAQVRITDGDAASPGTLSVDTGFGNPACGSTVTVTSETPEWAVVLSPAPAAEEQVEYRILADANGGWLPGVPVLTTGSSVFTSFKSYAELMETSPGFRGIEFRLADHPDFTASCTYTIQTGGV